jgi:hypothetical protein
MSYDDEENYDDESPLHGRITLEQLLLAANVLSAQNPQGASFDRTKLLEDAHEFALKAREVAFMTTFQKNRDMSEWRRLYQKFGYDRVESLPFVQYEEAAIQITGLKTEKQAVKRFDKLISENSDLLTVKDLIERHGVWSDLIPDLTRRDKKHSAFRDRMQKQANAAQPRPNRKKKRRKTKKALASDSDDSAAIR